LVSVSPEPPCADDSSHLTTLQLQNLLNEVGKFAERCLDKASRHGEVIIITNSDEGWVKFSAERYLPNLLPCLERYRVISARTRYERFYPNQPLCWKAAAFAHEVNEMFTCASNTAEVPSSEIEIDDSSIESMVLTDDSSDSSSCSSEPATSPNVKTSYVTKKAVGKKEVISFGDSIEERTAVKIVANQLEATPKSVMFLSCPTPVQIIGQLAMLIDHMAYLCENEFCLDIEITLEHAQELAEHVLERKYLSHQKKLITAMSSEFRCVNFISSEIRANVSHCLRME